MNTNFARAWLRTEGAAVLLVATLAYSHYHLSWVWFALLILAPDLSMLGYLGGSKAGALVYNLAHTYAIALGFVAAGLCLGHRAALGIGLVWCAHIGMDRALGYGLKLPEGFRHTHLGLIGRIK